MKRSLTVLSALAAVAIPLTLLARTYDTSHLPYSDAPSDRRTAVAVSILTEEGILQGDPSGTFRPTDRLNRAEFIQIAMRLYERNLPRSNLALRIPCFPDVPKGEWYTLKICTAKELGIIKGNDRPGLTPDQWPFEPNRAVQYEEALKILFKIFALPTVTVENGQWYDEYTNGAVALKLHLSGVMPGDQIRRGEMAQLAAAFLAASEGELQLLRDAQEGKSSSSSSSVSTGSGSTGSGSGSSENMCRQVVCPDGYGYPTCTTNGNPINYFADPCLTHQGSSSSSVSSSSSMAGSGSVTDQYGSTVIRSQQILLGQVSPVLGAAKVFPESEPLDVRKITISLVSPSSSIDALLVFNDSGALLGTATEVSTAQYVINLSPSTLVVPQRQSRTVYARARLKDSKNGGTAGQDVQVYSFQFQGYGSWSNTSYVLATSETFLPYKTSNARLTSVRQTSAVNGPLAAGLSQLLGTFRFEAEKSDSTAHPRLTSLVFTLESNNATLSNVRLQLAGSSQTSACTVASTTVTCADLDASIGSLDAPLSLSLYGDIAVSGSSGFLRVSLVTPGTSTTAGDITWTDGVQSSQWVPFDVPVARGTYFSR